MNKPKVITITDGVGTAAVLPGTYDVTANVVGYDNASLTPKEITVTANTDTFNFTISATGTLTIHVTEEGTESGTPVVGATFVRADAEGNEYGEEIVTDAQGNAVFENVPWAVTNAPVVYFKQTASDNDHEFDDTLMGTTLNTQTKTIEIANAAPTVRTFTLTDANYENLPIESGQLILS